MTMDMLNRLVSHKKFGAGVIKSCENGTMQVYFQQYGARFFHYPEIFDQFLSSDDEALMMQVNADLDTWRADRAAKDIELAQTLANTIQAARPVKKPATRKRATK